MKKVLSILFPFNDISEVIVCAVLVVVSYMIASNKQAWLYALGATYVVIVAMNAVGVKPLYRFEHWRFVRNK